MQPPAALRGRLPRRRCTSRPSWPLAAASLQAEHRRGTRQFEIGRKDAEQREDPRQLGIALGQALVAVPEDDRRDRASRRRWPPRSRANRARRRSFSSSR